MRDASLDNLYRRDRWQYLIEVKLRDMQSLQYEGLLALGMGLVFLAACIGLRSALQLWSNNAGVDSTSEGLMIIGWVAMWRPVQIFLHDWWSLLRMRRAYEKIRDIEIALA